MRRGWFPSLGNGVLVLALAVFLPFSTPHPARAQDASEPVTGKAFLDVKRAEAERLVASFFDIAAHGDTIAFRAIATPFVLNMTTKYYRSSLEEYLRGWARIPFIGITGVERIRNDKDYVTLEVTFPFADATADYHASLSWINGAWRWNEWKSFAPIDCFVAFSILQDHSRSGVNTYLELRLEEGMDDKNSIRFTTVFSPDGEITVTLYDRGMHGRAELFGIPSYGNFQALNIPNGAYTLAFVLKDAVDRYDLKLDDSAIRVTGKRGRFTRSLTPRVLWKVPANTFYLGCGGNNINSWVCNVFLERLLEKNLFEEFVFPPGGEVHYPPVYFYPPRCFRYKNAEDFTVAGETLRTFVRGWSTDKSNPGVDVPGISLTNWLGDQHLSWVIEIEHTRTTPSASSPEGGGLP